ncbi:MAG: phospholipid carrier-dependent glycosyltransferase [Polyangiaceae bacterium]
MAFPAHTALVGLAAALALTFARVFLRRGLPPGGLVERRPLRASELSVVLVAVGAALVFRLIGLESRPVDNDEPVGLGLDSLSAWAGEADARLHPPLPSLLFTWAGGARDLLHARSVSALAGIACVPLAYAALRRNSRFAATLAAAWVAVAPALLHPSQLARGYALAAAGVLAQHVCLSKALERGRERWFMLYALCASLALATEWIVVVPVLLDAALAFRAARASTSLRVGIVGALGSALAATSVLAPFAFPTLWLGVGGGPHAPTGIVRAGSEALAAFSGPAAPASALVCAALVLVAWRRGVLSHIEARLASGLVGALAVYLAAALFTAVRARYLLHVVPSFVCVSALAAARLGPTARVVGALVVASHAALLPGYYRGAGAGREVSFGRRTPGILELLQSDPRAALAIVPYYSLAEPSWRLLRRFPGADAGHDCPVELCLRAERELYGASDASLPELRARSPRLWVWVRREDEPALPGCELTLREAGTSLWRCAGAPP